MIQILAGVFFTTMISGFLGMGGGMILMALYAAILPIQLAMILHGVTQLSANGFRAHINRTEIQWKVFFPYLFGSILTFTLFKSINYSPNKSTVYLFLGAFPFVSFIPVIAKKLSITKKGRPLLCGAGVTASQLIAGASGGILDIFYINSPLNRHQIIATKAITQSIGHFIKLIYYSTLAIKTTELLSLSIYIYPAVIILAFIGTRTGKMILDSLSDRGFKRASKIFILVIAVSLLYRGWTLL